MARDDVPTIDRHSGPEQAEQLKRQVEELRQVTEQQRQALSDMLQLSDKLRQLAGQGRDPGDQVEEEQPSNTTAGRTGRVGDRPRSKHVEGRSAVPPEAGS